MIKPCGSNIYLNIEQQKSGVLDMSSRKSAIEVGEVIEVGPDVKECKKGDCAMFKSWAVDICDFEGEQYYFLDEKTGGIKAIICKEDK